MEIMGSFVIVDIFIILFLNICYVLLLNYELYKIIFDIDIIKCVNMIYG